MESTKTENMIFAGFWYGDSKPSMVTFLKPLSDTLSKLSDNGIIVQPAKLTSEPFVCKVNTVSLPARQKPTLGQGPSASVSGAQGLPKPHNPTQRAFN